MKARTASSASVPPPATAGPGILLWPLGATAGLLALGWLPRVQQSPQVAWAVWGAAVGLLAWQVLLALRFRNGGLPGLIWTTPRAQHYIQACCQFTIYLYWGQFWPPVYQYFPLLLAQMLFAYAFGMLLSWTRRQPYALGLGPVPIILSTNLFMWFKDEYYPLQFVLIAVGVLGKAFVQWERDGRRVHIFNPSAFTLALFSLILIATGQTSLTWAQEIATTIGLGPHTYKVMFAVGLVAMYNFATTPVSATAAATLFTGSALVMAIAGVPYFVDSDIPAAVFLGLHLLVTDPSTSPRSTVGRVLFGMGYGVSVFALYAILAALGAPTFYDKLLCVPILNLLVPAIDRLVTRMGDRPLFDWLGVSGPLGRANLPHMAAWVLFFGAMTLRGVTDGMHTGDALPFWQQACEAGKPRACDRLLNIEANYCRDNAGWACNELGRHFTDGRLVSADADRAFGYFSRACEARYQPGCLNMLGDADVVATDPRPFDLRLLLREGGPNLLDMSEPDLYARACRHGWSEACPKAAVSR